MNIQETLTQFCEVKNIQNSIMPSLTVPNRVQFILSKLKEMEIPFSLDSFCPSTRYNQLTRNFTNLPGYYYNIIVKFDSPNTDEAVMFTAHHDVNNIRSENCQDNSASVINLLRLCYYLKDRKNLERNIYIVFTDCEEFGGKGSFRLSEQIIENQYGIITYIVNSELTAIGDNIWIEQCPRSNTLRSKLIENISDFSENLNEYNVPFNDAIIFRRFGIDSVCIGILPKVNNRLKTEHWRICHSIDDTLTQANYNDMEQYVQFLLKLI